MVSVLVTFIFFFSLSLLSCRLGSFGRGVAGFGRLVEEGSDNSICGGVVEELLVGVFKGGRGVTIGV